MYPFLKDAALRIHRMKSHRIHRCDLWPADISCVQLCLSVWCYTPGFVQPQSLGHFLEVEFHPNRNSISFFCVLKCVLNTTLQGKQLTDLNLGCIFLHWVWISPVVKNTPWQRLCAWNVNQPKLNPPQTHHVCSGHFSFSELWQTQQTSTTAELGVPAEDSDKLPFLPYPRPRLFVFSFF